MRLIPRPSAWLTVIVIMAIILPALSLAATKKIAVLEFINKANFTSEEAAYLADLVRNEATRLPNGQFSVMTRENMLTMLPEGTDLANCKGNCEVETGRNVGADYVVSGRVIKFGSTLKVSIKLHKTTNGLLIVGERASAKNLEGLEKPVIEASQRMFARLGQLSNVNVTTGPAMPGSTVAGSTGVVSPGASDAAVEVAAVPRAAPMAVPRERIRLNAEGRARFKRRTSAPPNKSPKKLSNQRYQQFFGDPVSASLARSFPTEKNNFYSLCVSTSRWAKRYCSRYENFGSYIIEGAKRQRSAGTAIFWTLGLIGGGLLVVGLTAVDDDFLGIFLPALGGGVAGLGVLVGGSLYISGASKESRYRSAIQQIRSNNRKSGVQLQGISPILSVTRQPRGLGFSFSF